VAELSLWRLVDWEMGFETEEVNLYELNLPELQVYPLNGVSSFQLREILKAGLKTKKCLQTEPFLGLDSGSQLPQGKPNRSGVGAML
jgi:hypothetical protein